MEKKNSVALRSPNFPEGTNLGFSLLTICRALMLIRFVEGGNQLPNMCFIVCRILENCDESCSNLYPPEKWLFLIDVVRLLYF